ncbi:hypothetical protein PHMEG_00039168 [Phytophthora megakarya]|uniref:HTH CENPB-type domain-containing protein n=1 Tax=Phytophthora megakarya TaxID=4795 RepID=A0A225UGC4_9STRA|nr:hypothetical protein PHMEG_00039168 [Phytophthora megakarya]
MAAECDQKFKRAAVTYMYDFKLHVLRSLDTSSMVKTVTASFPTGNVNTKRRQVYAWMKLRAVIERKYSQGARFHHRGRSRGVGSTVSVQAEEQLVRWIMGYERMGVPVTGMMLKMQAQEMYQVAVADQVPSKRRRAGENPLFVVTYCHFAAVREGQSTPLDGELKPSEFSKEVRQKMQELGLSVVYNEVNYEYVPTTTNSARDQKTVWVKCGGQKK